MLVSLPKYDNYFIKLHWGMRGAMFLTSFTKVFFLMILNHIIYYLQMRKDVEACKKLLEDAKIVKDCEESALTKKLQQ